MTSRKPREVVLLQYGEKISKLRAEKNISQQQLADILFVSRDLVSKWENGTRRPNSDYQKKLSEIFDVDIEYFGISEPSLIKELDECIPESIRSEADVKDILNAFLETLSERDCDIFVNRYYFMMSTKTIGKKYDTTDIYIRVILSRTRKKLQRFAQKKSTKFNKRSF